jgi:hypothetical protein
MSIRVQTEGGFAGDAYVEVRMYLRAGGGNPGGVGGGSCGFYGFDLREVRMLGRGRDRCCLGAASVLVAGPQCRVGALL